jgi:hypothetical protein
MLPLYNYAIIVMEKSAEILEIVEMRCNWGLPIRRGNVYNIA